MWLNIYIYAIPMEGSGLSWYEGLVALWGWPMAEPMACTVAKANFRKIETTHRWDSENLEERAPDLNLETQ